MEQGVDQGSRRVSRSRVDHHVWGLIHDDDGGILIQNGKRETFRPKGEGFGFSKPSRDPIVRLEVSAGLGRPPIQKDTAFLNQFFGLRSRKAQILPG